MATPFKKQIVRYHPPDGARCGAVTPGAIRSTEESRNYYGLVPQANRGRKAVPLCPDFSRSKQILNKLLGDAACRKNGVNDPFEECYKRPLLDHLDEWEADLKARGRTAKHASLSAARARRVIGGCNFLGLADLSASAVQACLAELRKGGSSVATANHHLRAIKGFARWLVRDRRMAENPLAHLSAGNAKLDRRHDRRELTAEEVSRLLGAAQAGPSRFGIAAADRVMLYAVALRTGLRASELASLAPDSFDLDADTPIVTVQAAYSKHRREDVLPLHPGLAAQVRGWLAGKPADAPLWPGKWARLFKAGKMLQADLAQARQAWVGEVNDGEERKRREQSNFLAYRDGEGRVADFHALRHTFISSLARAGVAPKVAQCLARHSTITLTMDRYTHVGLHDTAAGIAQLPPLSFDRPSAGQPTLARTGTDDGPPRLGCTLVAQPPGRSLRLVASTGNSEGDDGKRTAKPQPFPVSSLGTPCHPPASGDIEEAPPGFEPGMADLQSAAFPLG